VGKWQQEFSEYLRGADVVILPHNDDAGRAHSELVAGSLHGIAKRIRALHIRSVWPHCPVKGDISDWIAAGGAAERLIELVDALQDWAPPQVPPAEYRQSDGRSSAIPDFWPKIDDAAYSGLVGDIVQTILPHTEADAVALLIQTLVMAGNVIGRLPLLIRLKPISIEQTCSQSWSAIVRRAARGPPSDALVPS
jgi:hypothetical protein